MLELEPTDIYAVVDRAIASAEPIARVRGSEVGVVRTGTTAIAEVDSRRIERILRNLVVNAVEHGEGRPVTVHVGENDDAVSVVVEDHGVGLRAGEASLVFNRFWRADPARARTTGGTGLGLAISLEDARLHHGWLQAWGEPGQGSRFRLTLPKTPESRIQTAALPLTPTEMAADPSPRLARSEGDLVTPSSGRACRAGPSCASRSERAASGRSARAVCRSATPCARGSRSTRPRTARRSSTSPSRRARDDPGRARPGLPARRRVDRQRAVGGAQLSHARGVERVEPRRRADHRAGPGPAADPLRGRRHDACADPCRRAHRRRRALLARQGQRRGDRALRGEPGRGEWRISKVQQDFGRLLPSSRVDQMYRRYRVHYAAIGWNRLVPDLRWIPSDQEATRLVRAQLGDVPSYLAGRSRPTPTRASPSTRCRSSTASPRSTSRPTCRATRRCARTSPPSSSPLMQLPAVTQVALSVAGSTLDLPGIEPPLTSPAQFGFAEVGSPDGQYAIVREDERAVPVPMRQVGAATDTDVAARESPFSDVPTRWARLAVSLDGKEIAGVRGSGLELVRWFDDETSVPVQQFATHMTRPVYDASGCCGSPGAVSSTPHGCGSSTPPSTRPSPTPSRRRCPRCGSPAAGPSRSR
ncbi:ATP-binding protein [Janibacter melonis]|uniref:ATP-binding protein n=1 Tax=Janibacter melonis TaxID=262209 RepID=UPI003555D6ED